MYVLFILTVLLEYLNFLYNLSPILLAFCSLLNILPAKSMDPYCARLESYPQVKCSVADTGGLHWFPQKPPFEMCAPFINLESSRE